MAQNPTVVVYVAVTGASAMYRPHLRDALVDVGHVCVESSTGEKFPNCRVLLTRNEIRCLVSGASRLSIPLTRMKSIDIHQPIFGANYITGEFLEQGSSRTITMTFSKGGATEFARAFFRVTEGRLVCESEEPERESVEPSHDLQSQNEDKKNK